MMDARQPLPPPPAWVLLAYLIAGICFILALRGLSSPVSSRRGNRFGMFGMAHRGGDDARPLLPPGDEEFALQWHEPVDWDDLMLIGGAIAIGARRSASSPRGGSR